MSPPTGLESSPDDVLVRRISQGDDLALAIIYDRYAPMIFSVTRAITRSESDAEEVSESVFLQLWKAPDRFDPARGSLRTYLGTIARSRAPASRRRTEAVKRSAIEGGSEFASPVSNPGRDPEEELLETETRTQLRGLLGGLSDEQRTAIELAFLGGLTQSEIAQELGVPLGTVKTRIRDGMAKLRERVRAGEFAR